MARRILRDIKLDKIAAVDRPCQEGAVVAILKRAPEDEGIEKVEDDRLRDLQSRILLAKSGMALLSTMLVTKWDESQHPRANDGEFTSGGSGGGSSASSKEEETKPKSKSTSLSVLHAVATLAELYGAAQTIGALGLTVAAAATPGGAAVASVLLMQAGAYALGTVFADMFRRTVRDMNKSKDGGSPSSKQMQQKVAGFSEEQAQKFNEKFVSLLSDDQAAKVASYMQECVDKAKKKLKTQKPMKKKWSDEARSAAAEARKRAGHHREMARDHEKAGRDIWALKHDVVADHYEEAAHHFSEGNLQRGHDVRRRGEAILGIEKASAIKKIAKLWSASARAAAAAARQTHGGRTNPRSMLVGKNKGPRRGNQGPKKSKQLIVGADSPGSIFGINKTWSDAARKAAAEARAHHHIEQAKAHVKAGDKVIASKGDDYPGPEWEMHDDARAHHAESSRHFGRAAELYGKGNTKKGNHYFRRGVAAGRRANRFEFAMEKSSHRVDSSARKIAETIAKSSIVLAALPDPAAHVRKVIGNTAADYIHDFVNSSNPKFKGKSKQERIRQALGAYYGSQK